jgi:drug/metabolite transporter (DMT)-like permease
VLHLPTYDFFPSSLTAKGICVAISAAMAIGMYIPLFRRFRRRHHTRDFSKLYCWLNFGVQMNNGVLAVAERAPFLVGWYICQSIFTGLTLWLVYRYWDCPPPRISELPHP